MACICLNSRGKAKPIKSATRRARARRWARLPALLSWGPRGAPNGGFVVNKECYGPPLAGGEGSWRSLLPALSQWRSHNGKLKAEAIQQQKEDYFSLQRDSEAPLRDRWTAISQIYQRRFLLFWCLDYFDIMEFDSMLTMCSHNNFTRFIGNKAD